MEKYQVIKSITLELAEAMLDRAEEKAKELKVAVNMAITDQSGHLKAFRRMDGAPLLSIGISQRKAYTASAFGIPTGEWFDLIKDHPRLLHGIPHTPDLVIFGGGFPIEVGGEVIGAIGVSGGTEEEDEAIGQAALSVLYVKTSAEGEKVLTCQKGCDACGKSIHHSC
ncbi:heme-binding protein [Geobacillus proteiniphilus]|uniref:Heme-binding protein n=1 Tax=Geobacillus proteiniphilus TaxID=860353 RepID=A0ABY9MHL6_9BACL|nr:heme-binding protein [Geobacillus proteiniphilus]WMJ16243.1 heme-binding protein [Geobacillus proteiniphilus]